jgi:hypothetical protein
MQKFTIDPHGASFYHPNSRRRSDTHTGGFRVMDHRVTVSSPCFVIAEIIYLALPYRCVLSPRGVTKFVLLGIGRSTITAIDHRNHVVIRECICVQLKTTPLLDVSKKEP